MTTQRPSRAPQARPTASSPIETLHIPQRPYNALLKAGIETVGQLLEFPRWKLIREVPGVNRTLAQQIFDSIRDAGLHPKPGTCPGVVYHKRRSTPTICWREASETGFCVLHQRAIDGAFATPFSL